MIDPKLLRTELTRSPKNLPNGYELDKAFWQQVEEQRKSIQSQNRRTTNTKMRAPKQVGLMKHNGENTDALMAEMATISSEMKQAEDAQKPCRRKFKQQL